MKTLTIRIPRNIWEELEKEHSLKPHMSLNALIIEAIRMQLGESIQAKELREFVTNARSGGER